MTALIGDGRLYEQANALDDRAGMYCIFLLVGHYAYIYNIMASYTSDSLTF